MKENIREITVHSSLDHSAQPNLLFMPETEKNIPLVVGLHTWSYDRFNKISDYLPLCQKYGWALLLPEFRGPNLRSNPHGCEACGSEFAQQDILDALGHVLKTERIASDRIFLLGASGGGHAALLTAARSPERWRGIAVWCPVSDLMEWHTFFGRGNSYAAELEYCLGGSPDEQLERYRERSPLTYAETLSHLPLSIHQGRHDDIVPWKMTHRLYEEIEHFLPEHCYYDLFDGGHDEDASRSFSWFASLSDPAEHDGRNAVTG